MAKPIIKLKGENYELATTLRVAYKIQGQHNHKPYADVFAGLNKMTLDEQVAMLYAAFTVANPDTKMTKNDFFEAVLDEYGIAKILSIIAEMIEGIMFNGMSDVEIEDHKRKTDDMQKMKANL